MTDKEKLELLRHHLLTVLDQVDYVAGYCHVTEMVGALLPEVIIQNARDALEKTQGRRNYA